MGGRSGRLGLPKVSLTYPFVDRSANRIYSSDVPDESTTEERIAQAPSVRSVLEGMSFQPSRKLGQNFLADANMGAWIVAQLEPGPDDCVIEVGPGLGALTRHLVGRVRKLILIEKDYRLADRLRDLHADDDSVEVHRCDACEFDTRTLFEEGPIKFIGNLPYSAAGEIMRRLLDHPTPVVQSVLMLQKEVAERLVAKPKTKQFGVLTLQHAQRWQVDLLKVVPPQLFIPVPQIDSAVVRFSLLKPDALPLFDRRRYSQLLKMGFSQRRKQLRKLLPDPSVEREGLNWERITEKIGIAPTARAEELDRSDWINLARMFDGLDESPNEGQSPDEIFDVVDENDQVIRQERRAVVHAEGLTHRAIHIFAFDKKGNLFLQRRSHLKDTKPLRWDSSAAGHVDSGEDYDTAAVREIQEELGVSNASRETLHQITKIDPCDATGQEFVGLYKTIVQPSKIRIPPAEIDTGEFFPIDTVKSWVATRPEDFADGFILCLKTYLELENAQDTPSL